MNDDYLVVNGLTHHFDRAGQNERNVGIGYEKRQDNSSLGLGVLKDSYDNWSPYAQASWFPEEAEFGPLSLGLTGALSYRQKAEGNKNDGLALAPMLTGEIMITDKDGVNIAILPPIPDRTGGLAMLQYKHLFGGGEEEPSGMAKELQERLSEEKAYRMIEEMEGKKDGD